MERPAASATCISSLFFAVLPILLLVISITLGLKAALTTVVCPSKTMISLPLAAVPNPRNSSPIFASLSASELPKRTATCRVEHRVRADPCMRLQVYLPTNRAPIP